MKSIQHMGEEPIGRLLLRYSIPAILGFFTGALYQLVDRIMLGRGVGTEAVAAVTAAFPLSILAMAVGMLVGAGSGNHISVLLGKNDTQEAQRFLAQGLRMSLINGVILAVITWIFTKPLLLACGCAPNLLPLAVPFTRIVSVGQIALIAILSMGSILRMQGHPVLGFFIMFLSNVVNALLAAAAIFVFHLGVTGTAIATAISQILGMLAILAFVQSKRSMLHIRKANLKKNPAISRAILKLGLPFGFMQVLGTLVFLSANHGAGSVSGTRGVATLGILNTIAMLLLYPPLGVMQAMQPLLGYNLGSGNIKRVQGILVRALATTLLMSLAFALVVLIFPHPIASLFSRTDQELIGMVARGLPWSVFPITLFGLTGTLAHYFLSTHQPKRAAVLMLGRQLLAIPLFLFLPRLLGFQGIYMAFPLADAPFSLVAGWMFFRELGRLKRQIQPPDLKQEAGLALQE